MPKKLNELFKSSYTRLDDVYFFANTIPYSLVLYTLIVGTFFGSGMGGIVNTFIQSSWS
jgi:hypothetical protein